MNDFLNALDTVLNNNAADRDSAKAKAISEHKNYVVFSIVNGNTLKRVYYTYKKSINDLEKVYYDENGKKLKADIKTEQAKIEYKQYLAKQIFNDCIVQDLAKAKIDELIQANNNKAKANNNKAKANK